MKSYHTYELITDKVGVNVNPACPWQPQPVQPRRFTKGPPQGLLIMLPLQTTNAVNNRWVHLKMTQRGDNRNVSVSWFTLLCLIDLVIWNVEASREK